MKRIHAFITDNAGSDIDDDDSEAVTKLEEILWNVIYLRLTEKIAGEKEKPPMTFMNIYSNLRLFVTTGNR